MNGAFARDGSKNLLMGKTNSFGIARASRSQHQDCRVKIVCGVGGNIGGTRGVPPKVPALLDLGETPDTVLVCCSIEVRQQRIACDDERIV